MNALRRAALIASAAGGLSGGLGLLNRTLRLDDLPPTLPGSYLDWQWRGHRVRYTKLGSGPPIVLVHSVHAAASSFEFRGIFEPLAKARTAYAIDLLGFGKSERPEIDYTGALYADLLTDFLAEVIGEPVTLLTSSLAAAYGVQVATRRPDLVDHLVLISPTDIPDQSIAAQLVGRVFEVPVLGEAAFNGLASRVSIRGFLRKVYADPDKVDDALVGQNWATSHQPGARYALAAFVSGRLGLPWDQFKGKIGAPILVLRGSEPGLGRNASEMDLMGLSSKVTFKTIQDVGQVPHDEAPDAALELITSWLRQ